MPDAALLGLLPAPPACAESAAFVTLIANVTFVPGALCLASSLRRVRSTCPLVLVVADPLPAESLSQLRAGFNTSLIVPLSRLRQRVDDHKQALSQPASSPSDRGRRLASALKSTRQLTRDGGWARRTHQKLLLFALEGYRRLAFLDIDMLVARNVDAILHQPPFAAVAALPYATKVFNSGVFVFEPSLADAAALDELSLRATFGSPRAGRPRAAGAAGAAGAAPPIRIRGAGERFLLSDQSILNHHFRGRWRQLPYGYNMGVKTRSVNRKLWARVEVAVVHFVHRPKPWEPTLADPSSPMSLLVRCLHACRPPHPRLGPCLKPEPTQTRFIACHAASCESACHRAVRPCSPSQAPTQTPP